MNCEGVQELLLAYLDGEVSVEEKRDVEAHLAECAGCSAEIEALTALQADLTATVGAVGAAIQLPPAAEARIAGHLETQLRKGQTWRGHWLHSWWWCLPG
jgi:anti-sigma factor RsiW